MEETKIIYHIDEEETPYLVKIPKAPDKVTLLDFKSVLNRPNYKFFFKSMDADFGVVKEEVIEDDSPLPCFNGRVVSWIVSADSSVVSDNASQSGECDSGRHSKENDVNVDDVACTEAESAAVAARIEQLHRIPRYNKFHDRNYPDGARMNGHSHRTCGVPPAGYESSSMISSDLESTSYFDSDDDASSHITATTTGSSSVSRLHARHRRKKQRRHRFQSAISRTSSISSITDSTMSLNIVTVTLNMDTVNFLGISIVGQSSTGGDGGIYVGSIMKGGAVALDGRIEPGDMILQVNDINFENMNNDEAVRILREVVQKPGPIKLVVAKCWDPNPKSYFTIPRTEPVRPIDPVAWVAHTQACRAAPVPGEFPGRPPSVSTLTSTNSTLPSSIQDSDRPYEEIKLTISTPTHTIVRAMAAPDSGLEIRDRMWLKITIPSAFIGADVVDWLHQRVEGFGERREARKYASQLLKNGYIRHTVNKKDFSEQCYYVFGDICSSFVGLKLVDDDNMSDMDRDTLGPLPPPSATSPWTGLSIPYSSTYIPPISGFAPVPFNYANESYTFNRDGSRKSGSEGSSGGAQKKVDRKSTSSGASGSDSEVCSQLSARRIINTTTTSTAGGGSGSSASTNLMGSVVGANGTDRVGSSGSERSSAASGSRNPNNSNNPPPLPPTKPPPTISSKLYTPYSHSITPPHYSSPFYSSPLHNSAPYSSQLAGTPPPIQSYCSQSHPPAPPPAPPPFNLSHPLGHRPMNRDLSGSTSSFNMAMANPCNFFIDSV